MVELYKRNIWNDAKTVNVISTALFNKVTKICVAALKFFVGRDEQEEEVDSDSDEDTVSGREDNFYFDSRRSFSVLVIRCLLVGLFNFICYTRSVGSYCYSCVPRI